MKSKVLILLTLLAMLLVSTMACGGGGEPDPAPTPGITPTPTPTATPTPIVTPTPTAGYITYTDEANGFSISYPEDWEIKPGAEAGFVIFMASSACDAYTANFLVTDVQLPTSGSVQGFSEVVKEYYVEDMGFTLVSEEELTLGGTAAIKLVFTGVARGQAMSIMRVVLTEGKPGWRVSGSCATECWPQYEPLFNTMVNSFRLLD